MPFLQYKKPHVANADDMAFSTLKPTRQDPIYFFLSHVKPGRNTFVVQHVEEQNIANKVIDREL